jgi:hypothetical protein
MRWIVDKFVIKENDRKGSINRTMRFPIKLDMKIEEAIEGLNITYSKFVMLACEFALERFDKGSVPESMKYIESNSIRNKKDQD